MATEPIHVIHDPEFAAPRFAPAPRGGRAVGPGCYQRLLGNPFLAAFVVFLGVTAVYHAERVHAPELVRSLAVLLVLVSPAFLRYHCLDCGASGLLFGCRQHACESVRWRQATGRPRRLRGPSPYVQALLWSLTLPFAIILYDMLTFAYP